VANRVRDTSSELRMNGSAEAVAQVSFPTTTTAKSPTHKTESVLALTSALLTAPK
jgi:hypothetical protein